MLGPTASNDRDVFRRAWRGARPIPFASFSGVNERTFHLASTVSPAGLATARGMDDEAARSGAVDASMFSFELSG